MNKFPHKEFEGVTYQFSHLKPLRLEISLSQDKKVISLYITFSCHCFTEKFDSEKHFEHHKYTHKKEIRAFDKIRYECSLQLPSIIQKMLSGKIYRTNESYTYVTEIVLDREEKYSIFFSLEKSTKLEDSLRIFIKSAYLKPLVSKNNAQNWRFQGLAGIILGIYPRKIKKMKPKKKKTP